LRTISNDEAAETFAAEMEHLADLASDLPSAAATDVRDESKNA
jgi:hypothetical protein